MTTPTVITALSEPLIEAMKHRVELAKQHPSWDSAAQAYAVDVPRLIAARAALLDERDRLREALRIGIDLMAERPEPSSERVRELMATSWLLVQPAERPPLTSRRDGPRREG